LFRRVRAGTVRLALGKTRGRGATVMKSTSIRNLRGSVVLCASALAFGAFSTGLAAAEGERPGPAEVLTLARYFQQTGEPGGPGSRQLLEFIENQYLAPGLEKVSAHEAGLILEALDRLQEPEKVREALRRYDEGLSEKRGWSVERCRQLRVAWSRENEWQKERKWASREYQALFGTREGRRSVDSNTLLRTGRMLRSNLLTGPEFDYPEYTAVLLRLSRSGKLEEFRLRDYVLVCAPLQSEWSLEMMRVALAGSKARPQPELLMVFAWCCLEAGQQERCDGLIEEILSHGEVKEDLEAEWLAAAARAEGLLVNRALRPIAARMRRAIAEAQSPSLRLRLLYEALRPSRGVQEHSRALRLLEEAAGDFKDPVAQASVLVARAEANRAQVQLEAGIRAARALLQKGDIPGRRAELLRRLAAAKQRRDTARAARLEKLLKEPSPPDQP